MRKVQTSQVSGLDWQQYPGNYHNSREDILVSHFSSSPSYKQVLDSFFFF